VREENNVSELYLEVSSALEQETKRETSGAGPLIQISTTENVNQESNFRYKDIKKRIGNSRTLN